MLIEVGSRRFIMPIGSGNYTVGLCGSSVIAVLSPDDLADYQRAIVDEMVKSSNRHDKNTIRLRGRGTMAGYLYSTRIMTTLSDTGVITRGFE